MSRFNLQAVTLPKLEQVQKKNRRAKKLPIQKNGLPKILQQVEDATESENGNLKFG